MIDLHPICTFIPNYKLLSGRATASTLNSEILNSLLCDIRTVEQEEVHTLDTD